MAGRPPLRIGQHGKISRSDFGGGIWKASCRYRDLDGVTRRIERATPIGDTDQYGAKAEEALHAALAARRPPGSGNITSATTLGLLIDAYLVRCREDGELAPKSVDTYEATLNAVRHRMVDIRVSEATPGLLDEILRGIRRDHGATRERHTKVALNSVLTDAVMAGAITANPARELASRRKKKGDKKTRGAPALSMDLRAFLKVVRESEECRAKDLTDVVTILHATGLRRSELLALRWEDIDLDRCVLQVNGGVVRIKGQGLIRQDFTKSGDGRTIALPEFAVDCLRRRKELWRGPNTAGVIFPSSTGTIRDPDNMGKQWRGVRGSLGLPDVSSHSFRKTVATLIDDSGLSARFASDQLGHARTSMTQDVYMSRGTIHAEVASALDRAAGINVE